MEKISVIGPGIMGTGISQLCAYFNYKVVLIGKDLNNLNKGKEILEASLQKYLYKNKISKEDYEKIISNIEFSIYYEKIKDSFLVIECVPEDLKLKTEVFKNIESFIDENTILATNTSSISINKISENLKFKENFIGLHFFNPPFLMKLVEIITGNYTSKKTLERSINFVKTLNKEFVIVKDSPGFVSNRMLMLFINEAIKIYEERIASKEDIDKIAKIGFNHPMGPLELADFIGLDVCLNILNYIYESTKIESFKPAKTLIEMVKNNKLGRKTNEGFYKY